MRTKGVDEASDGSCPSGCGLHGKTVLGALARRCRVALALALTSLSLCCLLGAVVYSLGGAVTARDELIGDLRDDLTKVRRELRTIELKLERQAESFGKPMIVHIPPTPGDESQGFLFVETGNWWNAMATLAGSVRVDESFPSGVDKDVQVVLTCVGGYFERDGAQLRPGILVGWAGIGEGRASLHLGNRGYVRAMIAQVGSDIEDAWATRKLLRVVRAPSAETERFLGRGPRPSKYLFLGQDGTPDPVEWTFIPSSDRSN